FKQQDIDLDIDINDIGNINIELAEADFDTEAKVGLERVITTNSKIYNDEISLYGSIDAAIEASLLKLAEASASIGASGQATSYAAVGDDRTARIGFRTSFEGGRDAALTLPGIKIGAGGDK
ncbi:unnamed protein product, partial [Ostreobium quekettii]